MKYANRINARYVVIVGEEIKSGEVVLRDMESGEQRRISVENLQKEISGNS